MSQISKPCVCDKSGIYMHRNAVDPENKELNVPKGKVRKNKRQFYFVEEKLYLILCILIFVFSVG